MPHFCKCGANEYICQVCARIFCSREYPSVWMKIPDKSFSGNVCPKCIEEIKENKMKLVVDGKDAVIGQTVVTFRGDKGTLKGWQKPYKEGSTGRVYVRLDDGGDFDREFFPSVVNGKFIKEE